jgi:hypothetical protein
MFPECFVGRIVMFQSIAATFGSDKSLGFDVTSDFNPCFRLEHAGVSATEYTVPETSGLNGP